MWQYDQTILSKNICAVPEKLGLSAMSDKLTISILEKEVRWANFV